MLKQQPASTGAEHGRDVGQGISNKKETTTVSSSHLFTSEAASQITCIHQLCSNFPVRELRRHFSGCHFPTLLDVQL